MRRAVAALAAAVALAACGGDHTPDAAPTTAAAETTTPPPPKPTKPKPKPTTATPTPTPTAKPTTAPPPVGDVVTTEGATLALATDPGGPRKVGADCKAAFADLRDPACGAVRLDGGDLLWATGVGQGEVPVARLYVLDRKAGGYVLRYEGRDDAHRWTRLRFTPGALLGHPNDGLAVVFRLTGTPGETTYDVLTWVNGGPLVLRAHRPALGDGRVAVRDGWVEDYEIRGDGTYARRRLVWDGRHFRLSPPVAVPASRVPGY